MTRKLLSLIALVFFVFPSLAQTEATAPLIAFFNDGLYQLEGNALVPYDACTPDEGFLGQFIPSNDGKQFLILTWPKIISQALEAYGTLGDIPYGPNIWLCNTETDSLTRILAQPNADDDFVGELPSSESIQSRPAWSPDGTQIAWTELAFLESEQSLVVYDIASDEMRETVLDLPLAPFPSPPETYWTEKGILLFVYTLDEITFLNVETLYILDASTAAISNSFQIFSGGETSDFIADRAIVRQETGLALALRYYEAGWSLVDLITGEQSPVVARLGRYSAANPEGIRLTYDLNEQYSYDWAIIPDDATPELLLPSYPLQRVALSPDGTQVAYADSVLHIYSKNNLVTEIANSEGFADDAGALLFWGVSEYTLVVSAEAAAPITCEGAPTSRLIVGQQARVIEPTIPNNIRSEASANAQLLGQIPGGASFDVLAGPVCADGYAWYQIQYEAINGWTVEGTEALYFLEPLP